MMHCHMLCFIDSGTHNWCFKPMAYYPWTKEIKAEAVSYIWKKERPTSTSTATKTYTQLGASEWFVVVSSKVGFPFIVLCNDMGKEHDGQHRMDPGVIVSIVISFNYVQWPHSHWKPKLDIGVCVCVCVCECQFVWSNTSQTSVLVQPTSSVCTCVVCVCVFVLDFGS